MFHTFPVLSASVSFSEGICS